MMEEQRMNDEIEIDLVDLFYALLNKIKVVIMCMIIGVLTAGGVTNIFITPQYEASSMIYILGNTANISGMNLQLSQQLTVDFEILAKSRPVINKAIDKMGVDYTYEEVVDMVEVENPTDSSILRMTATSPDPQEAADLANAMADATASRVAEVMATDKPSTVEQAVVPEDPASPSLLKNMAIGGLLGVFLAVAVVVVLYIMDDTITTEEDVKKYLNLNTMAAIPKEKRKKKSA